MRYSTVFFDLYGTFVDVRTDEDGPVTWERFRSFLAGNGAVYESGDELRQVFRSGERRVREAAQARPQPMMGLSASHSTEGATRPRIKDSKLTEDPRWADPDLAPVFRSLFEDKGVDVGVHPDLVARAGAAFRMASLRRLRLYPGATDLLQALRGRGLTVVLLSNAQHLYTIPELKRLGLTEAFDHIFISSDFGRRKPSPAFFRHVLAVTGADPSTTLMAGNDAQSDILGANLTGLDSAFLFTGGWPGNDRFPLPQATYNYRGADYDGLLTLLTGAGA